MFRLRFPALACVVALLLAGVSARAQVTFTFAVTASSSALGYVSGNSYSFTFVTSPSFGSNANSYFESYQNLWKEENTAHDQLFASIAGSGLGGSFTRPINASTDPWSYVETNEDYGGPGSDGVWVGARVELGGTSNLGLTTNGGASVVRDIYVRLDSSGTAFAYPGAYLEPTNFFSAKNGTFFPTGSGLSRSLTLATVSDGSLVFAVTSFSISAIPEPSTYAALAGLAMLAFGAYRRRRAAVTQV